MDTVPAPSLNPSPQPTQNKRKNILFFAGVIIIIILVSISLSLFIFAKNNKQQQLTNATISPTINPQGNGTRNVTSIYGANNPLISKDEQQRESAAYQNLYKQAGQPTPMPEQEHHLKFILPAKYRDNTSSLLSIPQAYAESSSTADCSGKLSGDVNVYLLKNNLTTEKAKLYADAFGLTVTAASVPMDDGSSFFYQYTTDYTRFLNVAQPSAELHYHVAIVVTPTPASTSTSTPAATSLTQSTATTNAKALLTSDLLDKNAVYDAGTTTASGNEFITTFIKSYGLSATNAEYVPLVNSDSIVADATTNVCNVKQAMDTDMVEIHQLQVDGTLTKIDDTTRKIDSITTATGISVDESVDKEYGADNPAFEPIVIPLTAKTSDLDTVTVTSVALVWFDYPDTYKQVAYVPMYLVAGTLADGTKAYGLFPAISKADFAKLPVSAGTNTSQIQMQPYYPPLPKPSGPVGGCYGDQVDYTVTCKENTGSGTGVTICSHYFEGYVGSKDTNGDGTENDPMNICTIGNKNTSDPSFTAPAGSDVCKAFVQKQGIDTSGTIPGAYPGSVNYHGLGSASYDGSPVVCTLSGNAC